MSMIHIWITTRRANFSLLTVRNVFSQARVVRYRGLVGVVDPHLGFPNRGESEPVLRSRKMEYIFTLLLLPLPILPHSLAFAFLTHLPGPLRLFHPRRSTLTHPHDPDMLESKLPPPPERPQPAYLTFHVYASRLLFSASCFAHPLCSLCPLRPLLSRSLSDVLFAFSRKRPSDCRRVSRHVQPLVCTM